MVLLCFEPEQLLIKEFKALSCFRSKAQHPSPLGTADTPFEVITFWATNLLLGHNVPQLTVPLLSARGLCAPSIQR